MPLPQPFDFFRADLHACLTQELIGEQTAAPNREFYSLRIERLLPGKDVLVDAVDECAVEVEEKYRFDARALTPPCGTF
jgi:hypothetical protein